MGYIEFTRSGYAVVDSFGELIEVTEVEFL